MSLRFMELFGIFNTQHKTSSLSLKKKADALDKLAEIFWLNSQKSQMQTFNNLAVISFREFESRVCEHYQKKKIRSLSNQTSRYHLFRTWTV